jgi:hypothetical protein
VSDRRVFGHGATECVMQSGCSECRQLGWLRSQRHAVAGKDCQIASDGGALNGGFKTFESFIEHPVEAEDTLEKRDAALDAGAEIHKNAMNLWGRNQGLQRHRAVLGEGCLFNPRRFEQVPICFRGEAPIECDRFGRFSIRFLVCLEDLLRIRTQGVGDNWCFGACAEGIGGVEETTFSKNGSMPLESLVSSPKLGTQAVKRAVIETYAPRDT